MTNRIIEPKYLMSLGYAFPCCFCSRMSFYENKSYPECKEIDCGGLFIGKSFPRYKGPLTKTTIATHCFRCGKKAKEAIVMKDGGYLGVCEKHLNSTVETSSDTLIPVRGDNA